MLKRGSTGQDVLRWQQFLNSKGYNAGTPDGIFGAKTETATKAFQSVKGLTADGIVGPATLRAAGMSPPDLDFDPPLPDFPALGSSARELLFGKFEWKPINSSEIRILGNWVEENIVKVHIPTLDPAKVEGWPKDGTIRFHKKAAPQLKAFFQAVEDAGLTHRIISYAGSFYPRRIRGGKSLSNHSFGSALDINAAWNWLGREPARAGQTGYLKDLVPIAHKYGFFWGGHFRRKDGMHFECAQIVQVAGGNVS